MAGSPEQQLLQALASAHATGNRRPHSGRVGVARPVGPGRASPWKTMTGRVMVARKRWWHPAERLAAEAVEVRGPLEAVSGAVVEAARRLQPAVVAATVVGSHPGPERRLPPCAPQCYQPCLRPCPRSQRPLCWQIGAWMDRRWYPHSARDLARRCQQLQQRYPELPWSLSHRVYSPTATPCHRFGLAPHSDSHIVSLVPPWQTENGSSLPHR
mmetsp:Transcript_3353/g.10368  ORF Transcript_3353/g.10368 Transcript_3353/m.10368 type:complete len:213 (+) Transcript_3353:1664-2302(+)